MHLIQLFDTMIHEAKLKEACLMKNSKLVAILKRLDAMTEVTDSEVQTRRFEKDGVEKCLVNYDPTNTTFELTQTGTQEVYQFDDIDFVAIEIFDLLEG